MYQGTDNVALVFSGDGATSTGDHHEGLNIASVLRLPLVIVVENNQWAFGTPNRLQFAVPTLALRAMSYGRSVEGYWIDSTNVLTVFDTVSRALERARSHRVSIIETASMRLEGHSLADPAETYVPADQLRIWQRKVPIRVFRERLLAAGIASERELADLDARVVDEVRRAAIEAEQSPISRLKLSR